MLYPESRIEEKLGFDRIRELLRERCGSALGEQFVERMRFSHNFAHILKVASQTAEFQTILAKGEPYPHGAYEDLSDSLRKAAILGAFLLEEEVYAVRRALGAVADALAFFAQPEKAEAYPELQRLTEALTYDQQLIRDIDRILDEKGRLRNNASPELARIRQQINSRQQGLRHRLDDLLRQFKAAGYAKDDASPTIRDGRLVVPVAAEHKRTVRGLVHDASATGQTVYIEPQEVLDLNNEVRELQLRERQEIIRILTEITNRIRPQIPSLEKSNLFLGMMDFIRAKARFAQDIGATLPQAVDAPLMAWRQAVHPLLLLSHRQQGKPVVPQNIALGDEQRILVISGPNAGGKSIALKTAGLVQYMWQCGLLVPMMEHSTVGIFKNIFLDIGDEQSLDNDLSTYSSHLTNMKHFAQQANRHTLCLIDEFGTGTEPKLGAAIAEAILEHLNRRQVFGVITTHYANLKFFADRTPGLVNGAMRYDVEQLQPLYELEIGQPGSSFALEIAQKIGLPDGIVQRARKRVGEKEVNVERLLAQLEMEKKELEEQNAALELERRALQEALEAYTSKKEDLDANRRKLINEAKAEAARIMEKANQKIEMAVKAIKEHQADRIVTKQVRHEIARFKEEIQPEEVPDLPAPAPEGDDAPDYEVVGGEIAVGDFVKIKGQEAVGEVVAIANKDATVMIGELKSNVKLNRLTKVSRKAFKKQQKAFVEARVHHSIDLNEKLAAFSPQIDIRGKRAEEVYAIVEHFMDNAIMFNHTHLRIVHGKGTGALRETVRQQLRAYREVSELSDEHADRGGPGVTLITLSL
jgi:DNA mismatch repair protein MutS2